MAGGAGLSEHGGDLGFVEGGFVDAQAPVEAGAGPNDGAGAAAGAFIAVQLGSHARAVAQQRHRFAGQSGDDQLAVADLGQELIFVDVELAGRALHAEAGVEDLADAEVALDGGEESGGQLRARVRVHWAGEQDGAQVEGLRDPCGVFPWRA